MHPSPSLTGAGSRQLDGAAVPRNCRVSRRNRAAGPLGMKAKVDSCGRSSPKLCAGSQPHFVSHEACCLHYVHSLTRGQNEARSIIYSWIFVLLKSFLQTFRVHRSLPWPRQGRHQGDSWEFFAKMSREFSLLLSPNKNF